MEAKSPIFIIGAPRSGTTLLGKILSSSPSVTYFEEPNVIWRYKNWKKHGHEEFSKDDATDDVKDFIRKNFSINGSVFIEKTPANALRLDFIREIYPNAKFIFLYRNSEAVVKSMKKKWLYEDDKNGASLGDDIPFRQLRLQATRFKAVPFVDKPFYFKTAINELMFQFFGKKRSFWGPQYKNFMNDAKLGDIDYICHKQWNLLTSKMIDFSAGLPEESYFELTYEHLVKEPSHWVIKLANFCGINDLTHSTKLISTATVITESSSLLQKQDAELVKLYDKNCKYLNALNEKLTMSS